MKPTTVSSLCLLLLLPLLALGCGGEGEKSAVSSSVLDPCALITATEAEQALGQTVQAPETKKTHNPLGQSICFYSAAGEDKVRFVQVSLVRTQDMDSQMRQQGYTAARLFQDTKALVSEARDVPGLGQAAFFGGSGLKAGAGLHVLQQDTYLTITVAGSDGEHDLAQATRLAAKALERLK